jgi:excisionase family DNA binding protein
VQVIVQRLYEGMTQDEIAVNLGVSSRQLRRRALEDDSNVVCIDACADYVEYVGCTVQQLATILQCSRGQIYKLIDEKRLPALRVGTLVRLNPRQIAEWIRSKMTIIAA